MKRYIYITMAVVAAVLALGVFYVSKLPEQNYQGFSQDAVNIGTQPFEEVFRGKVEDVLENEHLINNNFSIINQSLDVKISNGPEKGNHILVHYEDMLNDAKVQEIKKGETIIIGKLSTGLDEPYYVFVDRYRLPYLGLIALIFFACAVIFGRIRGVTSLIGLMASLSVLIWFITPNILAGKNPIIVTFVGAGIIVLTSIFLAHGFSKRTSLAVVSTLFTLTIAQTMAYIFVTGANLAGNGSENAFFVQAGYLGVINLQGLLLGGIIIGTLGILDDITTTQTATVEEIHTANPALTFKQLYEKGSSVGREHITSLINTLVLTYAGVSLPLFLLFSVSSNRDLWMVINSGAIAEEIVRTMVGSITLILAVPISTALSAYYFHKEKKQKEERLS
jgi:uncharacterized membrane protein